MGCGTSVGAKRWLNVEPCGLMCGMTTWFLLYYGVFAVTAKLVYPWLGLSYLGLFFIITFDGLSLLAMYSHFAAMTTDPGAVPSNARPLPTDTKEHDLESGTPNLPGKYRQYCKRCKAFKPP